MITTPTKNLGVVFDNELKFDKQVNFVVKSSFFHLRSLAKVKSCHSFKNFQRAIDALTTSREFTTVFIVGVYIPPSA